MNVDTNTFQLNDNLKIDVRYIDNKLPYIVIDNFWKYPDKIKDRLNIYGKTMDNRMMPGKRMYYDNIIFPDSYKDLINFSWS